MEKIIGRNEEKHLLEEIYKSKKAEFIAIYGRRRIGKTFLIEKFFRRKDCLFFHVTGLKEGLMHEQLINFTKSLEECFYGSQVHLKEPENWNRAFETLTNTIKRQTNKKKIILFFDELPWLASKKSNLLQNLDYYWNRYWSNINNLKLIVCGSSASWMINKLIRNKGGLHNRTTARMVLYPFNLHETKEFLKHYKFKYTDQQILDLYMITGGIPYYLSLLSRSKSVVNNIDSLCFRRKGALLDEFNELYSSLFSDSEAYEELVRIIASRRKGIERKEILKQAKHSTDGGAFKYKLQALEEAGFIVSFKPYGYKKRGIYYRIIDEYTLFYLTWIEPALLSIQKIEKPKGYWKDMVLSASWTSWVGYTFELICYKHLSQIREALDISVTSKIGGWYYYPKKGNKEEGAQIDLLFDRNDKVITICEIKYTKDHYRVTKQYAKNLLNKIDVFKKRTKTNKQVDLAMITVLPLKETMYSEDLVTGRVILSQLFKR